MAFSTYFGAERPFYQLAHNLVLAIPPLAPLRRFGTVAATPENAANALAAGAVLLVYPGGDHEVSRPVWERNVIDFDGRRGFVRQALDAGVPLVPVVSIGGQETALFLSRGTRLARALRLDRTLRLKTLPISIAAPWGLNVGDFLGHIPLPAKITVQVLPAIDLSEGGDHGGRPLLYFYAAYRALVRAKVACLRAGELPPNEARSESLAEARELVGLARRLAWRARSPLCSSSAAFLPPARAT